jgi:hypothetical protein
MKQWWRCDATISGWRLEMPRLQCDFSPGELRAANIGVVCGSVALNF